MPWYVIPLIVIGYLAIAVATGFLAEKYTKDPESSAVMATFWPITLAAIIAASPYILLDLHNRRHPRSK